jgi:hypothetical protein
MIQELREKFDKLITEGNKNPALSEKILVEIRKLILLEGLPEETDVRFS